MCMLFLNKSIQNAQNATIRKSRLYVVLNLLIYLYCTLCLKNDFDLIILYNFVKHY